MFFQEIPLKVTFQKTPLFKGDKKCCRFGNSFHCTVFQNFNFKFNIQLSKIPLMEHNLQSLMKFIEKKIQIFPLQ